MVHRLIELSIPGSNGGGRKRSRLVRERSRLGRDRSGLGRDRSGLVRERSGWRGFDILQNEVFNVEFF